MIVTDGFTGNVALKTGEGTAKLISDFLREAFNVGILSRLARPAGAWPRCGRLQRRIDPRRRQRRGVPGAERHRGQVAWLGRCDRRLGGDPAGVHPGAVGLSGPACGTGCLGGAGRAGCDSGTGKRADHPNDIACRGAGRRPLPAGARGAEYRVRGDRSIPVTSGSAPAPGIERRHFAAEGETTSDMATARRAAALADAGMAADDIDAIISPPRRPT